MEDVSFPLLQLPDPCILTVLRCCDQRSLCSLARTSSRLHTAAVQTLHTITARVDKKTQLWDNVLLYISKHGQHIGSLDLSAGYYDSVEVWQLPRTLQKLTSLQCCQVYLQLQRYTDGYLQGFDGVLGAEQPLKQLQLHRCRLRDGRKGLMTALPLLTTLEHISITNSVSCGGGQNAHFQADVLQVLPQLTHLELSGLDLEEPEGLQHLQGLTRLKDLRLAFVHPHELQASLPAGLAQLTRLEVIHTGCLRVEPSALRGMTQLQHFAWQAGPSGGPAPAQVLPLLQEMQQLTYLELGDSSYPHAEDDTSSSSSSSMDEDEDDIGSRSPAAAEDYISTRCPAATCSALTASSKLQHLDISRLQLPAGVWPHIFPPGRQLPQLKVFSTVKIVDDGRMIMPRYGGPTGLPAREEDAEPLAAAPKGSSLVSCCPGLTCLHVGPFQGVAELLAPLQGLSGLHELHMHVPASTEGYELVCQLTGLRKLYVKDDAEAEGLLLQLTQLLQLTYLEYMGHVDGKRTHQLYDEAASWTRPAGEPVWRQVLRSHLNHSDPAVAQQAAAALAE